MVYLKKDSLQSLQSLSFWAKNPKAVNAAFAAFGESLAKTQRL
jgi:hypothetical protein